MSERLVNVSHQEDRSKLTFKGITFRSKLELYTAQNLDALGIPFSYEPRKITLLEKFSTPYQKDMVRAITYTPDFEIGPILLECKGFETPEWKIKKKMVFKYLMENEPQTIFYQIHDPQKSLLKALDPHLTYLGYAVKVEPKPKKGVIKQIEDISHPLLYDSIEQAMVELGIEGKPKGAILRSLMGRTQWVYGYNWKLIKITL